MENIQDCINISGNAGHKIEYRRATEELKKLKDAIIKANVLLIAISKGEIIVYPSSTNPVDYVQQLEDALKETKIY